MTTIAAALSSMIQARENCARTGNQEWHDRHYINANELVKNTGPSGSGIDEGTFLTVNAKPNRLEFQCGFHHMDEHGCYDGWTYHLVIAKPTFTGVDLRITGPNRNNIKDYLHDVFYTWLMSEAPK